VFGNALYFIRALLIDIPDNRPTAKVPQVGNYTTASKSGKSSKSPNSKASKNGKASKLSDFEEHVSKATESDFLEQMSLP